MPTEPPPACGRSRPPATRGRGRAARARRRPRPGHAAGRLPRRASSRCRSTGVPRDGLVQPRPARGRAARRVPRLAARCAARARRFTVTRRPRVRRRRRGLRRPAPAGRLDHAGDARRLRRLHALGWAHSIEVWDDERRRWPAGSTASRSAACSRPSRSSTRRTDASKVALVALVERLRAAGGARLLDVQWTTPHLRSLGARDIAARRVPARGCRRRWRRRRRSRRSRSSPDTDVRLGSDAVG